MFSESIAYGKSNQGPLTLQHRYRQSRRHKGSAEPRFHVRSITRAWRSGVGGVKECLNTSQQAGVLAYKGGLFSETPIPWPSKYTSGEGLADERLFILG